MRELHPSGGVLSPLARSACRALLSFALSLGASVAVAADGGVEPATERPDPARDSRKFDHALPGFGLPIRCDPGRDCFVQNHFDRDPGPGWLDFACGALSYDGHQGTDFRLPNLAWMAQGVDVLAAASGRVVATRDGEPDVSVRERGIDAVKGREAGNAVRIDHGGGWETQYSHLRQGSVRVRPGQRVQAGEAIGLVGLSGKTEFPHVDFVVRHNGRALDPYAPTLGAGSDRAPDCRIQPVAGMESLWREDLREALRYVPSGVLFSGFAISTPDRERAWRGESVDEADARAPAIFFFVESFGLRNGDVERISIGAPDGRVILSTDRPVERNQAVRYLSVGARMPGPGWKPGRYLARYQVERGGAVVAQVQRALLIR